MEERVAFPALVRWPGLWWPRVWWTFPSALGNADLPRNAAPSQVGRTPCRSCFSCDAVLLGVCADRCISAVDVVGKPAALGGPNRAWAIAGPCGRQEGQLLQWVGEGAARCVGVGMVDVCVRLASATSPSPSFQSSRPLPSYASPLLTTAVWSTAVPAPAVPISLFTFHLSRPLPPSTTADEGFRAPTYAVVPPLACVLPSASLVPFVVAVLRLTLYSLPPYSLRSYRLPPLPPSDKARLPQPSNKRRTGCPVYPRSPHV